MSSVSATESPLMECLPLQISRVALLVGLPCVGHMASEARQGRNMATSLQGYALWVLQVEGINIQGLAG